MEKTVEVSIKELLKSVDGWQNVEIKECGEELVDLAKDKRLKPYIVLSPQYYQKEVPGSIERMWVRKGVAEALYQATLALPEGCKFKIWDAWRPLAVQQALFDQYLERLGKETQKYVSLPSTDPKKPSPHNTGGAIDLTIVDAEGKELNMGTEFDHFGPEAKTDYFEGKDIEINRNRRLLYEIMTAAGFTNYREEWWHFDFRNQFWGIITGQPAIYGKITPVEVLESDQPCRFEPPPPRN